MSDGNSDVIWPAVIQLKSDDELIFIRDGQQFLSDTGIQKMLLRPDDRLIDSEGKVYYLSKSTKLEIIPTQSSITLSEAKVLLQKHLSNLGTCCVAKFDAISIREAFKYVFEEHYLVLKLLGL
jgi:hypothetical protein